MLWYFHSGSWDYAPAGQANLQAMAQLYQEWVDEGVWSQICLALLDQWMTMIKFAVGIIQHPATQRWRPWMYIESDEEEEATFACVSSHAQRAIVKSSNWRNRACSFLKLSFTTLWYIINIPRRSGLCISGVKAKNQITIYHRSWIRVPHSSANLRIIIPHIRYRHHTDYKEWQWSVARASLSYSSLHPSYMSRRCEALQNLLGPGGLHNQMRIKLTIMLLLTQHDAFLTP